MCVKKTKENLIKINPNKIPDADYNVGCSVLASSVRNYFEQPGVKKEYEDWLRSEEITDKK